MPEINEFESVFIDNDKPELIFDATIQKDYPMPSTPGTTQGQVTTDPYNLYIWTGITWRLNAG